jgi:tetratricopeptide (TPR) repeat protein
MTKDREATERVIKAFERFIQENGSDRFLQELRGEMFMRLKDYAAALDIYRQLHRQNPRANYLERFAVQAAANNAFTFALAAYDNILAEKPGGRTAVRLFNSFAKMTIEKFQRDYPQR